MSEMMDLLVPQRRGPWKHKIAFIAAFEKRYEEEEIALIELAKKIMDRLEKERWIWCEKDGKVVDFKVRPGLSYEAHEELSEICDQLHTIAYADQIFGDPSEYPGIDAYDYWKSELYDWADENRVWIEPVSMI